MSYIKLNELPTVSLGQQIFVITSGMNYTSTIFDSYIIKALTGEKVYAAPNSGGQIITLSRDSLTGRKGFTFYEAYTSPSDYMILRQGEPDYNQKYLMQKSVMEYLEENSTAISFELSNFIDFLLPKGKSDESSTTFPLPSLIGRTMYRVSTTGNGLEYLDEWKVTEDQEKYLYLKKIMPFDTHPFKFHLRMGMDLNGNRFQYLIQSKDANALAFFEPNDYWNKYLTGIEEQIKNRFQILDHLNRRMSHMSLFDLFAVQDYVDQKKQQQAGI